MNLPLQSLIAGIAVNVVGHNYKPLVDAVSQQASKMIHCSNLYYTEVQGGKLQGLYKRLLSSGSSEFDVVLA